MGANSNGDVREVNRKYYSRDVCRLYLSGLWPHELFQLTEERNKSRKLDRYDERRSKESRDHERESSWDRDWADSHDRGRDYEQRSRDHDRYNNRDRDRDYEGSRTCDSRSGHRSCSRSKERSRDYDRHSN